MTAWFDMLSSTGVVIRRRSAALNALEELAALPDLGAEGLRAMALAIGELVSADGAVVDLRNADCEVVGCIGDGKVFHDELIHTFFTNYYDTAAEDAMGPNCRTLFRLGTPLNVTTPKTTIGWEQSELFQEFFAPQGIGDVIRLPLWRGGLPSGLLVLGRDDSSRPLSDGEVSTLREIRPLCERIVGGVVAPSAPGGFGGDVTWVACPNGDIELASPEAEPMAAMAFGFAGVLPRLNREVSAWLRDTFIALREKLDRSELASIERRNGYGLFQFRASWLDANRGTTPRARLSVRLSRHVPLKTRLFLSERFRLLPRREKQTVLALSEGASTQELAERLEVAPSTAFSWIRSLYTRFDVNRRGQLIEVLLADAAATAGSELAQQRRQRRGE